MRWRSSLGIRAFQALAALPKVVENKSVIVIEQANPQVVHVPSYDPVVVYGPSVYPYPPITILLWDTAPRGSRFRSASA
jgi:hypothetical protein